MTRMSLTVCALLLFSDAVVLAQSPVRPNKGFIADSTSTISKTDRQRINGICQNVVDRTNGEILVCVIRSTSGRNPRQFATNLFNRWAIGDRHSNKGVLIFVAMQDRKAEIVLGDGIDGTREESLARRIMSDYMMPKFKQGKPSQGIRVAVEQCAELFFDMKGTLDRSRPAVPKLVPKTNPQIVHSTAETNSDFLDVANAAPTLESETQIAKTIQSKAAGPIVGPQPQRNRQNGAGFRGSFLALLTGGLTVGGAGFGIHRIMTSRRRPRNCQQCGQPMMLLDEESDNEHLDDGERLEERLRSVDYDVWVCTNCANALKLRYGKFFTKYSQCPSCRSKTSSSTSRTVRSATTMMSGLSEVETTCAHCSYHDITQHTIPIITQTSSSSSNFSSGSGGSFGGGSSSGGGASGSW